jgi:hypothetical protein
MSTADARKPVRFRPRQNLRDSQTKYCTVHYSTGGGTITSLLSQQRSIGVAVTCSKRTTPESHLFFCRVAHRGLIATTKLRPRFMSAGGCFSGYCLVPVTRELEKTPCRSSIGAIGPRAVAARIDQAVNSQGH